MPWPRSRSQSHPSPVSLHSTTPEQQDLATGDNIIAEEEVDPYSDRARDDLALFYSRNGIDDDGAVDIDSVHDSLLRLTEQVLSWNQKLNLVSRKDCNARVVYHRHILPSVALLPLILERLAQREEGGEGEGGTTLNVVDVGTGGGFPGLPLAVLLPSVRFTLVDSVKKKLVAVSEMAAELDVTNVRVHCGRVEEMYVDAKGRREHRGGYDVVLGRSVTSLPKFCAWVSDLLRKGNGEEEEGGGGRLIYIIGGELDEIVERRIVQDTPIDKLLGRPEGASDKRALIFDARDVEEIAEESGERDNIVRSGPGKKKNKKDKTVSSGGGEKKLPRGAWGKKRNDVKKQRGYDDFQRYQS